MARCVQGKTREKNHKYMKEEFKRDITTHTTDTCYELCANNFENSNETDTFL